VVRRRRRRRRIQASTSRASEGGEGPALGRGRGLVAGRARFGISRGVRCAVLCECERVEGACARGVGAVGGSIAATFRRSVVSPPHRTCFAFKC
jgi:hypothetical protein